MSNFILLAVALCAAVVSCEINGHQELLHKQIENHEPLQHEFQHHELLHQQLQSHEPIHHEYQTHELLHQELQSHEPIHHEYQPHELQHQELQSHEPIHHEFQHEEPQHQEVHHQQPATSYQNYNLHVGPQEVVKIPVVDNHEYHEHYEGHY